MRAEKLFYTYWPEARRFLELVVARGNATLVDRTIDFIRMLRRRVHVRQLRLILDAGVSVTNDGLRRLDRFRSTVFVIRAPRRPAYVKAWKRLPRESFTPYEEPGRYIGAKAKEIEIAETTTTIAAIARTFRTIVVRERAMKGKDRWHSLFVLHDDTTSALDLLHEYRTPRVVGRTDRAFVKGRSSSAAGLPRSSGTRSSPSARTSPLASTAPTRARCDDGC